MLSDRRALGFKDVLIRPEWSPIRSRKDVSLERTFKFDSNAELMCVPIIASNMKNIGTWETAKVLSKYRVLTCLDKDISKKNSLWYNILSQKVLQYVIPTVGLDEYDLVDKLVSETPVTIICLDVANGYMNSFVNYANRLKGLYPKVTFMAGNVATREGAGLLYQVGVDIIKVGLGSGSACTTRYKTGVGVPQVTAVNDVAEGWPNGPYVCSDGGCTSPGDVAKAFVAGADFVMLGGMFAGTKETGSFISGSAWGNTESYKTSEGKYVSLTNDEPLESLDQRVQSILGGLRSCGSYTGKDKIEDFYKAELIQVNEQTNDIYGPPN